MAASESDDEETFVTIGTAVDVPDQDEPLKKPVSFQDAPVKDNKGRQRFHGAFTGGFSAGYFNTVGTQEGWTPSTFISSRGDRSKPQSSQRPEDFMDEEDLSEYGIAPRKHVTSSTFASEERRKRRYDEAKLATSDTTLLGNSALLNLIIPERITIGVKLLRKMGWKEGQGVGPRITKRQKKSLGTKKVYGCELPPDDNDDDGFDDEAVLKDITFAPKDSAHILLNVKDNTKGLGYRGLDPNKALPSSHISLFGQPVPSKTGRKGIRGQAFGVGALEEDDDDIYTVDDMSNYDMTMTAENENESFGWTGSKFKGETSTPVGYVGKLLEGFKLASEKLIQKKDFPPPKLPQNFRPIHVFHKHEETALTMSAKDGVDYRQFMKPRDTGEDQSTKSTETLLPSAQSGQKKSVKDSVSRSLALGEQPFVGSIFDLIPEHDKKKMDRIKAGVSVDPEVEGSSLAQDTSGNLKLLTDLEMTKAENSSKEESSCDTRSSKPLYQGSALGFKPFATDSAKQERYDKYLALVKQGHKDPYNLIAVPGQTEWEMEREKEEFAHAARLFKPLAHMMAMRFTSAGTEDKVTEPSKQDTTELSEPAKAAAMKMYGKLTREVMEWYPDKLLCKRFNVPDPYPQSNMIGLASLRRDKYSVFNFLTFANPTEADKNQSKIEDKTEKDIKKDSEAKTTNRTLKPLPGSASTKGLKSIFTHLVDPAKGKGQSTETKKSGLSFSIKSKATEKAKELTSVFSDEGKRIEDDSSQKKQLTKVASVFESDEEGDGSSSRNKSSGENEKAGIDLFRAIFKNTDSEESSSDDDVKDVPKEETAHNVISSQNADTVIGDNRMEEESEKSTKIVSTSIDDSEVSTSVPSEAKILPGSGECIPSINQRLSPDVDSDSSEAYGPALPPPSNVNTGSSLNKVPINEPYIDLTKDSGRKHKHKHKDRHKAKKEKKNKSKKSRHKKKQKKREKKGRKHKEQEKSDTDSSDTTDKDTDSDVDIPSDRDLLDKMKQLQPGQRMRAADFL